MNKMTYQNYSAKIEYDPVDKIFVGHIVGIRDIVGFHGTTVDELEAAFHEAVDHYLEVCVKIGQEPQRPYSGKPKIISQYIRVHSKITLEFVDWFNLGD